MSVNLKAIYAFSREMYPKISKEYMSYGTAGFRGKAEILDSCMFRMGLLATLRSRFLGGPVIGVMITASHNPEPDNGIKLIDPEGNMLEHDWELIATKLANVADIDVEREISKIISEFKIDVLCSSHVYVGMDNRYHSPRLLKAVEDGVVALKGNVRSFGIVSTPMMHYMVVAANTKGAYGEPTEEGYYKKLITAFKKLIEREGTKSNYNPRVILDGANGVGALKILQILKRMKNEIQIEVINKGNGKINQECGADFVKMYNKFPKGMPVLEPFERCVSVDGDADRIVYFFMNRDSKLQLIDGDRIAILIADYLIDLVRRCDLNLKLGLVQTAYANGASTDYIKTKLNIPVSCVSTGVKHLHKKALEYDVGIYFEANGHGTVLFSKSAKDLIKAASVNNYNVGILQNVVDLINETVGDALSDMLLIEYILRVKDWDVQDWIAMYQDLPNIQLKVKVSDRNIIKTTDADRICISPSGLQDSINDIVDKYDHGRCFIRASGTEDIVRVYAEASTRMESEDLAYEVANLTHELCGGIGPKPYELRENPLSKV